MMAIQFVDKSAGKLEVWVSRLSGEWYGDHRPATREDLLAACEAEGIAVVEGLTESAQELLRERDEALGDAKRSVRWLTAAVSELEGALGALNGSVGTAQRNYVDLLDEKAKLEHRLLKALGALGDVAQLTDQPVGGDVQDVAIWVGNLRNSLSDAEIGRSKALRELATSEALRDTLRREAVGLGVSRQRHDETRELLGIATAERDDLRAKLSNSDRVLSFEMGALRREVEGQRETVRKLHASREGLIAEGETLRQSLASEKAAHVATIGRRVKQPTQCLGCRRDDA